MANQVEYGLFQLLDMGLLHPNQTAATVDSGLLTSAINYDLATHNAEIDAILSLFCESTTEYQMEVSQMASARNQPLDENGRSIPIKPVAPYTVAFPIIGSGNALGANYVTKQQMTVSDMTKTMARMYRGDAAWVRDHVLANLFDSVGYTFRDPTGKGDLAVKGLANGDAVVYYKLGSDTTATDTHYIAQAAGIADATNPFLTIKSELMEHPDNGGQAVCFVASNLVTDIGNLAEFHSAALDPDIQLGVNDTRLVGNLGLTLPRSAEVKGKTESGVWVVEWGVLPSSYMIAVATQGPRPLKRRLYPQEQLQGFRPQGTRQDFPYFEDQWSRFEGYGAFNRAGALCVRIGNGSWAVPTNYGTPMP